MRLIRPRFQMVMMLTIMAVAAFSALPAPAQAESPQVTAAPENPYLAQIDTKARALAANLSADEAQALAQIRESFGLIRSVRAVRKSVAGAVQQCGDTNPDMKEAMDMRFQRWSYNLRPVLEAQEQKLEQAVSAPQRFDEPAEIKAYLDIIDKAADHAERHLGTQVVTTPEACQSLLNSMDRTEENLLNLLAQVSWP